MTYPFEFKELILTDRILDKLGFTEYWAGSGDYGERCFGIKKNENQFEHVPYRIVEIDEKDDDCDGYCETRNYVAQYYQSPFRAKVHRSIYFLHDLYDDIQDNAPHVLEFFVQKCKENNMYPFIESYLTFKNHHNGSITNQQKAQAQSSTI
jgi:hypothetical protein